MRALTVRQPWAWSLVAGSKSVENRSRPMPQAQLGEWVAIHAGKAKLDVEILRWVASVEGTDPRALEADFAFGAIVGMARFAGVVDADRNVVRHAPGGLAVCDRYVAKGYDPWWQGPYGWVVAEAVAFGADSAVPCKGALGLWRVPPPVEPKVNAAFEAYYGGEP